MSLELKLPSGVCVGGQILCGEAELHFPQIIEDQLEEVHVKLRGSVYTRVSRQLGNQHVVQRQNIPIVAENISLWTRSSNYMPPADSNVLSIPFEFKLPLDTPPSCQYDAITRHGRIGYFVELVGDLQGEQIALGLRSPEMPFPWFVAVAEKKIRRGFFGDFASTRMELSIPETQAYPLFTPIPYTLRVIAITKPMKKDEVEKNPTKPLFPTPPTRPTEVQFRLYRQLWLKAHAFTAKGNEKVSSLGGLETVTSAVASGLPVNVDVREKEWIPAENDKNMGTWLQETTFRSAFVLTCAPTFQRSTIHLSYTISLKVEFPGIGNNLEASFPILVCSGLSAAPPYTPGPDQPPPIALDLPPSYWGSADTWDEDEKTSL
ncbi:hypothetical protein BXZ70DRAFT_1003376 [Cristinia sonorae]|uniref:Arrestin-like N-terminal domain-containing protein n=1 Tax=Cristinia sonorae TaxID=1940300 RepID=A0A8K0V0I0_9AGAR|nr:hypothetical protein BXZ70DRAFT_1003376 [Cristinia sonorae]